MFNWTYFVAFGIYPQAALESSETAAEQVAATAGDRAQALAQERIP